MHTHQTKLGRLRGRVIGLAVLSLAIPLAGALLRSEPLVPFDDPARLSYHRQTVAVIALALACAAGVFLGNRRPAPMWARSLSWLMASAGVLLSGSLLWTLIGSCGVQVLWGICRP